MTEISLPQTEGVEYRPIADFPGYCVGDDGSVWSRIANQSLGKGHGSISILGKNWNQLKPGHGKHGHMQVALTKDKALRYVRIHRLVLEAFIGPCPNEMEGCHNDGNPRNNAIGNLRWDTHQGNCQDRIRHGTDSRGEKSGNAKLTSEQVVEIHKLRKAGLTYKAIGDRFGVNKITIYDIVKGINWKHLLPV